MCSQIPAWLQDPEGPRAILQFLQLPKLLQPTFYDYYLKIVKEPLPYPPPPNLVVLTHNTKLAPTDIYTTAPLRSYLSPLPPQAAQY